MNDNNYIFGIRAVIEAIESGQEIEKVYIRKDIRGGDLMRELHSVVNDYGVLTQYVPIEKLNRITRKNHQGVIALVSAVKYQNLDELVPEALAQGITPLVIILDGITDVRNFGAIARTAECVGADAIVIAQKGSVTVGPDAVKTSAGALMHLPVCRHRSILAAVKYLKKNGFKVVAATEKATENYTATDYTFPVAIVMGAEDVGISKDVLEECDTKVSIPQFGNIGSLNVSVAAGVMMYEIVRQRLNSGMSAE